MIRPYEYVLYLGTYVLTCHCTATTFTRIIQHLGKFTWASCTSNNASTVQMTSQPMRKLHKAACYAPSALRKNFFPPVRKPVSSRCRSTTTGISSLRQVVPKRHLAHVRPEPISEVWFTSSSPRTGPADDLLGSNLPGRNGTDDHKPPDERLVKLGKSKDLCTIPQGKQKT
jgi:hypothetical protein